MKQTCLCMSFLRLSMCDWVWFVGISVEEHILYMPQSVIRLFFCQRCVTRDSLRTFAVCVLCLEIVGGWVWYERKYWSGNRRHAAPWALPPSLQYELQPRFQLKDTLPLSWATQCAASSGFMYYGPSIDVSTLGYTKWDWNTRIPWLYIAWDIVFLSSLTSGVQIVNCVLCKLLLTHTLTLCTC